jgi:hypothetical protein
MDIFFHNEFKKKNNNLIQQMEESINLYSELLLCINKNCVYNYNTVDLINFYNNLCVDCEQQLVILKNIQKTNDLQIYELCDHNFITDIIDINSEKEKTICYCTICELSKRE